MYHARLDTSAHVAHHHVKACVAQAARSQLAALREGFRSAVAGDGDIGAAAEVVRQASADADLRNANLMERCRCALPLSYMRLLTHP